MSLRVTVIICTLNRAQALRAALASVLDQSVTSSAYEIVVVDNGSTDDTRVVAEEAQRSTAVAVRYVHEPERGLSHARNRAVRLASAEILAFIDDDARADPSWVESLQLALDASPGTDAVGGCIRADEGLEIPDWFPPRMLRHLSLVDHGPREKRLTHPHYPFGTNMAFRRSVFERVGEFDTHLGRVGENSVRTGEETDLFRRLERAGGRILYVPAAIVLHTVERARLSPQWIYRQTFSIGRAGARMDRKSGTRARCAAQCALAPLQIAAGVASAVAARIVRQRQLQVLAACLVRNRWGYLTGMASSLERAT